PRPSPPPGRPPSPDPPAHAPGIPARGVLFPRHHAPRPEYDNPPHTGAQGPRRRGKPRRAHGERDGAEEWEFTPTRGWLRALRLGCPCGNLTGASMFEIHGILGLIFWLLGVGAFALSAYAMVHALRTPARAFTAAGKLTKKLWTI